MKKSPINAAELRALLPRVREDYERFRARGFKLNMTRGKPSPDQLDLSNDLLTLPGNGDWTQEDGGDTRNYYGGVNGLPEARRLFSTFLGAPSEHIIIANNSSLTLMHDVLVFALLKGVPDGESPWRDETPIFLCPVPGYDRHFAICEEFGIEMMPVPLTGEGPDMNVVEELVANPTVKGMWCVPKYSNPTGEIYSQNVIERLANMKTAAPDFRLFWDNAYAVHHLTENRHEIGNILETCEIAVNPNRPFVFASTAKMTFAGGGLALFASSRDNVSWMMDRLSKRTIGPDKLNQLRHVRFLKSHDRIVAHMEKHREILAPKFAAIEAALKMHLGDKGVAKWTTPDGGYFISIDVLNGCAKRVVELAGEAGIALVPAGMAYPYRQDPNDTNLRIAPSFPSLEEVKVAAEGIALSILLATIEKLDENEHMTVEQEKG